MQIPTNLITALSDGTQKAISRIDKLIDAFEVMGKECEHIDLWQQDYDRLQKDLKKYKYNLERDNYRGFYFRRKVKPRRYNKRKLQEFEVFNPE